MADKEDKPLEEEYKDRQQTLREFYHADKLELSAEELASITPIFNSLKDKVPRYCEIEKIAEGGEKKITLAHDHRLDRKVAMARAVHAKTGQDREQFLREARLTANLAHPNIVPVYNMGLDDDGEPFFTMELVPGESLKTIISGLRNGDDKYTGNYPVETLLNIFAKVCDAISYAHARNVLHLDIKPDNIHVGEFGEVLVCDWGLAQVINAPPVSSDKEGEMLDGDVLNDLTLSGTMKGTPGFMAPEQTMAGGPKTPQADIYSLGAVLYVMLMHKLPVKGDSATEVIHNTRAGNIIPLHRHVPRSLEAVVMKALALKPEKRYGSALELRQEINRYLTGHPTQAEHAGLVTKASLLLQRHSRMAFLLIFFLVVLASVIGADLVAISREKAEAITAREQAEENFRLYLEQQQRAEALGEDLGEAVFYTVKSRDFVNAASMINVLETGLEENVDTVTRQNLLKQKATLHFVLGEFNAARECFEEAGITKKAEDSLLMLSRKYGRIKPNDKKRMSDQELANLIKDSKYSNKNKIGYLYYHQTRRRPVSATPEEYVPLCIAMIDKLNYVHRNKEKSLKLEKRADGYYHLDLSRTPFETLTVNVIGLYHYNILRPLRLKSLDISHSGINNLYELRGLKLEELRMVGLKLENKRPLSRFMAQMQVKRLVIDLDAYPPGMVKGLHDVVETVENVTRTQSPIPTPREDA